MDSTMNPLHNATIREYRQSDLISVRRLIHETIDQSYTGVYPPRAVEFFKQFHSEENIAERSGTGTVLVVEQAEAIVATGTVVGNEIFGVFVNPACQRCGYGRALMRELETRAKAQGCAVVELSVSLPSSVFYESLGYEILEECSMDVGEGQRLDFWKARKSLDIQ
jgi:ribosomal protein S18 acetylase RimI-like enzyme